MFQLRLKELREKLGYSQYAFADIFGVAQSTVGNWEAGKREPNYATTKRLADFFGVSVDYLLGHPEDPAPPDTKKTAKDEIVLDDIEFGLLEQYRELDDDFRELLLKDTARLVEIARSRKPENSDD